jgi:hypothetical protein
MDPPTERYLQRVRESIQRGFTGVRIGAAFGGLSVAVAATGLSALVVFYRAP